MKIKISCPTCKKEFEMEQWWYNYRLKRNNNRGVFCSAKCGQSGKKLSEEHKSNITKGLYEKYGDEVNVKTNCNYCKKELILKRWEYNLRLKENERGIFCSPRCSLIGKKLSEETRKKIAEKQKGKSLLTRGRKGHVVSDETKEKIKLTKIGKPWNGDWDIVHRAAQIKKLQKYVVTRAPIPDIIYVEDGKLIAIEVEKKPWETMIRKKMDGYKENNGYDKVILMWFLPTGEFMKEWTLENGKWTLG